MHWYVYENIIYATESMLELYIHDIQNMWEFDN